MTNVNNVNGQSMVNSKEVRDSQLAALENKLQDLRESRIWESTGGTFETVFRDYMTRKQVAAFFSVPEPAIRKYTETGNDHKDELEEAGVRKYSKKELDELKISIVASSDNRTYDNDMTDSYTPNNTGEVLYPLRAVTKLGMFMTKTESAKLFRDAIIEMLSAQVTVAKAYQSTVQGYLQQMNISAQNGDIFDSKILSKIMKDLRDVSKVCYKQNILDTIEELTTVSATYNSLIMTVNMMEDNLYYSQLRSVIEQLTISISDLQKTIIKLDGVRLDANTATELYNRSDIIKDAVLQKRNEESRDYNTRINQLTLLLELAGYVSIEEDYQAPQRDAQGKKIILDLELCDSKSNVFVDIYGNQHDGTKVLKYVAGEKGKEWIFNNEYVLNRDTKHQVLKYTPVGRSLWGALYRQADVVYDKLVKQNTDRKTGVVDNAKIKKIIELKGSGLVKACRTTINLSKEEFEAQYAYAVLNNDTNTIVLL